MKLSVPTAGRLATLGFTKVAGMNSLFRHPGLPWALFKRVNTVQQAIACGGVFTSTAVSGNTFGNATIAMGETARYLGRHERLGSIAVTGSFVAKGVSRKLDSTLRYTPSGQNWFSQLYHCQLNRLSPHFIEAGGNGIFLAVITKAVDGCVANFNGGMLDFAFNDQLPDKTVGDTLGPAVGGRGLAAGVPAQWVERDTTAGSRGNVGGWHGFIDFGVEVRLGDLLKSRFPAWQAAITDDDAREAMSSAFEDEFKVWAANGKCGELHMLKNRAYLRSDGQVTGVAPDGNFWNSIRANSWFINFEDSIANGWDATRMQIATSMSGSSPMISQPVVTGMPLYSGFLDGTPLKAMDALLPIGTRNSGTYLNDSARPVAGFVEDASGTQVPLFKALNGTLNYPGPVTGTGIIKFSTQLTDCDRLRDPLVYQKTELSPLVDDNLDTTINLPADMGLARQRSEAKNSLAVSEMLRRAFDPLIGRVTEFDSRVQAKAVDTDLGDEKLVFWLSGKFPGRTPVLGPATDIVVLDPNA